MVQRWSVWLILKRESAKDMEELKYNYCQLYNSPTYDPHSSLAYGNMEIKDLELVSISFPESITFSSVALVNTMNKILSWQKVEFFRLR